ncbi:methyltransferase family protein [Demequina lutea]|uniref:Protein-S-isoprenylcysteine O-methyltransferase Ste14 n=1 Tax=Demequina lutea TaxID=431489 RepID=A0A7Y9ZB31_9MICO|nr:isoprenylcysteine carboxylmethyltransferase family protein [Demequina lutea]NYI41901.1 protein-S-isoprenylcysteine O-methyltransferase Ste14 [Demequina lutea]
MSWWSRVTGGGRASLASWGLVAIQGVLFVAIAVVPSSWGPSVPTLRLLGLVMFAAGGAGSLAAAWYLGRALTPVPEPNGAGISARGIYAWVRHPMYTSVVIAALGLAVVRGAVVAWILAVALGPFFELKTRREERFLMIAYSGYGAYASRTGKFIPWLGKRHEPPVTLE